MKAYGWAGSQKLDLIESWLELQTSPIFQLHRFSDRITEILQCGPYGTGTKRVKAVRVTGRATCLAIKVPSTPEIRRAGGLLIQAYADRPGPDEHPPAVQPDLFDPALVVARGQPPAHVAGLYMTERTRVLSITPYHVRLVATGNIVDAYSWGGRDHWNPSAGRELPADDLDALGDLAP